MTRLQRTLLPVAILLIVAGCAGSTVPSTAVPPTAVPSTAVPSPRADPTLAAVEPPMAGLIGVDGEPVLGQLGTYVWRDGGSDSPWLPGTPVTVSGRPELEFGLSATVPVDGWRARYTLADDRDPSRFESLGEGRDAIRIATPPPGHWTVELTVTFGDGLGEAVYYWQIDVQ